MKKIITNSERETRLFAERFANALSGGEVVALIGDLGSGKTVFAKGLAKGLGVKNTITSPTFVLMKVYKNLVHIDAYRLTNGKELEAIGATDYFKDKNFVTLIEWADRVKDILPKNRIEINFKVLDDNKREIKIK